MKKVLILIFVTLFLNNLNAQRHYNVKLDTTQKKAGPKVNNISPSNVYPGPKTFPGPYNYNYGYFDPYSPDKSPRYYPLFVYQPNNNQAVYNQPLLVSLLNNKETKIFVYAFFILIILLVKGIVNKINTGGDGFTLYLVTYLLLTFFVIKFVGAAYHFLFP